MINIISKPYAVSSLRYHGDVHHFKSAIVSTAQWLLSIITYVQEDDKLS